MVHTVLTQGARGGVIDVHEFTLFLSLWTEEMCLGLWSLISDP